MSLVLALAQICQHRTGDRLPRAQSLGTAGRAKTGRQRFGGDRSNAEGHLHNLYRGVCLGAHDALPQDENDLRLEVRVTPKPKPSAHRVLGKSLPTAVYL